MITSDKIYFLLYNVEQNNGLTKIERAERKMMEEGKYFKQALSSFSADVAYADAIRHLYDKGLDTAQIKKQLSYPVSIDIIEKVIQDYETKKNTKTDNIFVEDVDKYGRKSFRLVKKEV